MASGNEIIFDFPPFIRLYKDGSFERLGGTDIVRESIGVSFKDITIDTDSGVYVRVYIPHLVCLNLKPEEKLPLVVYIHGGGFVTDTPASPRYHSDLATLVAEAKVVAVSLGYRRAPEDVVPASHNDTWMGLKWVSSHAKEVEWLNMYADLNRVFIVGVSAGANLLHYAAIRAMQSPLDVQGIKIIGLALVHPYFSGNVPVESELRYPEETAKAHELWTLVASPGSDNDHPLLNPAVNGYTLENFPGERVLVLIAGDDLLRDRGLLYASFLKERGYPGVVEMFESESKGHVFHILELDEIAAQLIERLVSFIHEKKKLDLPTPETPAVVHPLRKG